MKQRFTKKSAAQEKVVNITERQVPTRRRKQDVRLVPRNIAQEDYIINLEDDDKKIVFAVGSAGTGKTLLATMMAVKELMDGNVDRIVITRPAVGTDGEKHGFLPGDINAKMEPWLMPILDVFAEYYSQFEIKAMMDDKVIEVAPIAFMRGRTFHNSIILADEFQGTTETQAKCILTRIGEGSRLFVTGDLNQSDFSKKNGLLDIINRLEGHKSKSIAVCKFNKDHVERSQIVAEILGIYGEE